MKKLFLGFFAIALLLSGCSKDSSTNPEEQSILPPSFNVDIPDAISYEAGLQKTLQDTVTGGLVYGNIGLYIHIGDASAELVNDIIAKIKKYDINQAMEITYTSEDDSRVKKLVVKENVAAAGATWQYEMRITDGDSLLAFQLLWNTNPVKGIAVLYPKYMNKSESSFISGMMYKVEYNEADNYYDKTMTVSISGLPVVGTFGLNNLKMFVGKKGSLFDIYGNSNHPYMVLFDNTYQGGRNYAFRARAESILNIGLAELALPPSTVRTTEGMFADYSVYKVFKDEINKVMPGLDSNLVNYYLANTKAPAYFVKGEGFVSAGAPPANVAGFTESFINISSLIPYIPYDIKTLKVEFF
jgi:hypothetical protein